MTAEENLLLKVAQEITDGEPVDWDGAMKSHPDLERSFRGLRAVESIAEIHRTPPPHPVPHEVPSRSNRSGQPTRPTLVRTGAPGEAVPRRWGPLEILEPLGAGGFGEVHRARDPSLQRDVALKLIATDRCESRREEDRFIREARGLAKVKHDNVVVIHGADRHDGRVGLWMDLVEGETLETCLRRQGRWRAEEAALDGIDLCRALAAVHRKNLVHRDVKTGNVMRRKEDGRLILMDFSACAEARVRAGSTDRQPISGTLLFMAPEVFRGEEPGVAADIYSLGVVLYRLVSGRFPVEGRSEVELREKHARGEATPLVDLRDDLPEAFITVVERALHPDPRRRFSSAGEMERALRAAATPPVPVPRPSLTVKALIAAAASLVLLVGGWWLQQIIFPPFEVEAVLYRLGSGVEERLSTGAEVQLGDQLFLEVEGSREMFVYVLSQDAVGVEHVLFPLENGDMGNPLAAGTTLRLPGDIEGAPQFWVITSTGGRETITVFASATPMPDLEESIQGIPRVTQGDETLDETRGDPTPQIAQHMPGAAEGDAAGAGEEDSREIYLGIGKVTPRFEPDDGQAGGRTLARVIDHFSKKAEKDSGLYAWQIHLENPGE